MKLSSRPSVIFTVTIASRMMVVALLPVTLPGLLAYPLPVVKILI